ncbi:DUF4214 domain-containing protein [Undibacterium sp. SXout7W]|uniref:DUF4214 domain-containing protein n=1 Tax=Undibacterium sp. SXout7W TaxID=3413049 RepID=UPI003BF14D5D
MSLIKLMADFSKAAYDLNHKNYVENIYFNDPNPNAKIAYDDVINQAWIPLYSLDKPVLDKSGYVESGSTGDGFFINRNAAVLAARSGDSIVIAFRGTNDSGKDGQNPNDLGDVIHPDQDQWTKMPDHYALLKPYLDQIDNFVKENGINHVYVTGHSMGGSMAMEYMYRHPGNLYEAVTFAATPFAQPYFLSIPERKDYPSDNRITQIEIAGDPGPMMFDQRNLLGGKNIRPGHLISLQGNETLDTPDHISEAIVINYHARNPNHSMDYYRDIAKVVDDATWDLLEDHAGTQTIFLGGRSYKQDAHDIFVVDGMQSGNNQIADAGNDVLNSVSGANVIYGGRGNDVIYGAGISEYIIGGIGDDKIYADAGADTIIGGSGNDLIDGGTGFDTALFSGKTTEYTISYDTPNSLYVITDMVPGRDGKDSLYSIEQLQFSDKVLSPANLLTTVLNTGITIYGTSGNDILKGSAGNDTLSGGAGLDIARYSGMSNNYDISKSGEYFIVNDKSGVDGTDQLQNVERLEFKDVTVALDISQGAGQVYRLYQAAFDRKPDLVGLGYWIHDMDKGASLEHIAAGFFQSPEFQKIYGNKPDNKTLLTNFYQNVLHRAPDPDGFNYWIRELNDGKITQAGALASFCDSPENQILVIGAIQNGIQFTPWMG